MVRRSLARQARLARRARSQSSGFTLLEVLVAVAILGLGLTVILSSQAGLFSSASRGEHMTVATNLLRCKMSEIELDLDQNGFNLTDENEEGDCCGDDEGAGYSCAWKIERVELPPMPDTSTDADAGTGSDPTAVDALSKAAPTDPLAKLQALKSGGDEAAADALGQMSDFSGGSGMESMVMSMVYPGLKPMLEASIRRVTVKVTWKEGTRPRELEVTQFLTRPQEGQLATSAPGIGGTTGLNIPGITGSGGSSTGLPGIPGFPGLGKGTGK